MQIVTKKSDHTFPAMTMLDTEKVKLLEYHHLTKDPQYHDVWSVSSADEFHWMAQGMGGHVSGIGDFHPQTQNNIRHMDQCG